MSRSERRAYQRMTKNQDPMTPPISGAARARLDRQRALRAQRATSAAPAGTARLLSGRTSWWVFGGGFGVFLIALSLAWPNGASTALTIGLAAGVVWIAAALAFAAWRRRSRPSAPMPHGRPAPR
ncbi:MAG: hypothetical protein M3P14_09765 [Chloroflexota bacterium]|nr:hypothetical protein [Chloroflexota bacterium]